MKNIAKVVVLALGFTVLAGAHCNPGPAWHEFVNCETAAVKADLPGVLPLVTAILISGGTNAAAEAALAGLGIKFGVDSVECAVLAAVVAFQAAASQPAGVSAVKAAPSPDAVRGLARGNAWLKAHKVTLKAK